MSCVEILQQTVLEVYMIFLQPIASSSTTMPGGLFGFHLREFLLSLFPLSPGHSSLSLEDLTQDHTSSTLFLEVWYHWIRQQIELLQSSAVVAFTRINSPAEVSKLQRLVSQSCLSSQWIQPIFHRKTHPTLPLPASAPSGFLPLQDQAPQDKAFDTIWYESCVILLEMTLTTRWAQLQQQYQHHLLHRSATPAPAGFPSFVDGGRMLWIYVFRQPFLSLVERLMKISCRQIFQTVKHSLLGILSDISSISHQSASVTQVTLSLDPLTLEMKYRSDERKILSGDSNSDAPSPSFSSATSSNGSGMVLEAMASSTELFLHAEKVRLYLENQMMTLMNELLFTVGTLPSLPPVNLFTSYRARESLPAATLIPMHLTLSCAHYKFKVVK